MASIIIETVWLIGDAPLLMAKPNAAVRSIILNSHVTCSINSTPFLGDKTRSLLSSSPILHYTYDFHFRYLEVFQIYFSKFPMRSQQTIPFIHQPNRVCVCVCTYNYMSRKNTYTPSLAG